MAQNLLINETSPYLLQHSHNPVHWYPWGEEAFKAAKKHDKPLLVSIGYAACHWCHVMEKECFEDGEVASTMNDKFICIKVDREERPDVDQIYMTALQLMTGSGGWPLNCFVLPDKRPFFGGTYYKKDDWIQVLDAVHETHTNNHQKVVDYAAALSQGIKEVEVPVNLPSNKNRIDHEIVHEMVKKWEVSFDLENGGNKVAPKFPMPIGLEFLMHYSWLHANEPVKEHLFNTLNKMGAGGIFDFVEGGFARYSVDKTWKIPHFEKMLYDNAQLLALYAKAYLQEKSTFLNNIITKTASFMANQMMDEKGGFYSSYDADSEGKEGVYYTWGYAELEKLLKDEFPLFVRYFDIQEKGNWEEGKNILHANQTPEHFAKSNNVDIERFYLSLEKCRSILSKSREKRKKPALDDKIIASWNGLALYGLAEAFKVTRKDFIMQAAKKNYEFITTHLLDKDDSLVRIHGSKKIIPGFLDDYANITHGLIAYYQISFDEEALTIAKRLTNHLFENFHDPNAGFFYYAPPEANQPVTRKMEVSDNVIASGNSQTALNLFMLGKYFLNSTYGSIAEKMLIKVQENLLLQGQYHANWARLSLLLDQPFHEIVVVGENFDQVAKKLYQQPDFNYLMAAATSNTSNIPLLKDKILVNNKTTIYSCRNGICSTPTSEIEMVLKSIQ